MEAVVVNVWLVILELELTATTAATKIEAHELQRGVFFFFFFLKAPGNEVIYLRPDALTAYSIRNGH